MILMTFAPFGELLAKHARRNWKKAKPNSAVNRALTSGQTSGGEPG